MLYKRVTKALNDKGTLVPIDQLDQELKNLNRDKDNYLSIYYYNKKQLNQVKEHNGSVSGITDVFTDKLYLDFDTKDDLETARKSTIRAVEILKENGFDSESIDIAFSGNKGFSVVANLDKNINPDEHKRLATNLFGQLPGFDESIYNASRIFRIVNTKHNVSGLFKIQLNEKELENKSIGAIKTLANSQRQIKEKINKVKLNETLLSALEETVKVKKEVDKPKLDIDFSKRPSYLTDTKYVLHQGYIPPSKGNTGMMILASTYKHCGMDKRDAYHQLKAVNERRAEIYGPESKRNTDEIWTNIIEVVYGPNWTGGTYKTEENQLLKEIVETHGIIENSKNIVSINDVNNRFKSFARNINSNIIKTGIKELDDSVMITTGMLVGVLGSPGSGKTSLASSFVEHLSKNKINSLFHSLDMHDTLLYSRLIQKNSELNVERLLRQMIISDKQYKEGYDISKDAQVLEAMNSVNEVYKYVDFNFTRGATIESIEEDIRIAKNKHGNNLKLVCIDYLEKVRSHIQDATASSGYVASRLSDLASKYDVCIFLLLQPQKSAGDAAEELLSMRKVKGASVIEQDCRVILTQWRPGFDPKDNSRDKYASVAVVKNNMGPVSKMDFYWNGLKGQLSSLDHEGRAKLKALIEDKEKQKKEEDEQKKGNW